MSKSNYFISGGGGPGNFEKIKSEKVAGNEKGQEWKVVKRQLQMKEMVLVWRMFNNTRKSNVMLLFFLLQIVKF
jgi:hypothetical protein